MSDIINAKLKEDSDNWMVDLSGYYTSVIKNYLLHDGIDITGINKIVANSAKTLGYCPDPKDEKDKSITGLVIGKVQSGKTSSFITLTALAFDNGYNIVVVLGGTKNNLLEQNKLRIEEYFEEADDVVVLSTVEDSDEITEEKICNFIELGKKIIIVTLKSAGRINTLRTDLFSKETINEQPILVIDDEGDEYSLNTLQNKNKESAVFKSIKNLLLVCKKRAFISVTATPQANIISPVLNILSPDFGTLVEPGDGYCGLAVFHDVDSKYCVTIPEDEPSILDGEGVPESFYKALSMYFVGAAIYHTRSAKNKKFSMLIHPSRIVKDLSAVKKTVDIIINDWRTVAKDKNDIAFENLENSFRDAFNDYKKAGVDIKDFDELIDEILYQLMDCGIHLITGQNHLNNKDKNYINNIYIGGDMVGRGLTIKGLAVTYIIRTSKGVSNVDTVQQRARWFGYKREILDLCRIFATEKILNEFEDIKAHEEDLWFTIEQNNLNGIRFKQMQRLFVLSDRLRMTRTSVGKTEKYAFASWTIENQFIENEIYQKNNELLSEKILNDYSEFVATENYKGTIHRTIRGISFYDFVSNYLNAYHFPINAKCNKVLITKIAEYLKQSGIDARCDLVWPRCIVNEDGTMSQLPSWHNVSAQKGIPNYMVGQNPKGVLPEEANYKGDRYNVRGNVIEIQFHNICDRNTGKCSLTLAMYMPPNYIGRMNNMIVGENGGNN